MQKHNEFIFDSIGSRFWLEILGGGLFDEPLRQEILEYAAYFDNAYSRFKEDSLVAQLAKNGALVNPPAELLSMLDYSKRMYEISNGIFNITVGATLHKYGYGSQAHGGNAIDKPWGEITWNTGEVRSPAGLMLDFGGFGKGWMIDKISEILNRHAVDYFIVNGGGDIYIQSDKPIEIALQDPQQPNKALRSIQLSRGALAGSDTIKRSWKFDKALKHHIIDPRLQDSSNSGIIASYVIADTALVADTLATIVIVDPTLKQKLEQAFGAQVLLITS